MPKVLFLFTQYFKKKKIFLIVLLGPKTTFSILHQIWKRNGISGLFTGVVPRVAKVAPACAIMVATFEYGKGFFERRNAEEYYKKQR